MSIEASQLSKGSVAPQLFYKKEIFEHPTYRFNKILPLSGSTTQTISVTGGTENIFELPVSATNLGQSFLTFQFNIPASPNPGCNNVFKDCFPYWRQVQLYTRSGIYICDLNEIANYTKVVWNAETKLQDFLDIDFMTGTAGAAGLAATTPGNLGQGFNFHRNGCVYNSYTGNAARPSINGIFADNFQYTVTAADVIHAPISGNDPHIVINPAPAASYYDETEPSYLYRSVAEAGAAQSVLNMNVMIPLKYIYNTIFSLDKDLYFGEIILLRIVWSPSVKVTFTNTNATNLHTGALAPTYAISVSNIALYLAVEKNPDNINLLRSKIAQGAMEVLIPYVYTYKNALTGTSQNVSLRFNRGHGRRLMKVYHSIFNGTESSEFAYDHNNINGLKCLTYYTMLNNERLQEYNVDCTMLDDYNLHRRHIKDTVLQNGNVYQYNWLHLDKWTGDNYEPGNLESGLDLTIEQKWDIYCNVVSANYNHYDYAVTQKLLTISPMGITVI